LRIAAATAGAICKFDQMDQQNLMLLATMKALAAETPHRYFFVII
jgi:hypothetical protein